jgi:hypothetical protein
MVAKLNSKTHLQKKVFLSFQPFRPRSPSKFVKSANMTQKNLFFYQECNMGIKKRRI